MAQLLACATRCGYQVGGILVTEESEGLVSLAELYRAVGCQIFALRVAFQKIAAGEKGLGAIVIARAEMNLGKPKSILVIS